MATVTNRLAKPAAKPSQIVEYLANGETVKISKEMIKKYLVNGGGNVTDEEVVMFLNLCRFQHLNPFIREAYLIKYGSSSPATMVIGKDVLVKRAKKSPEFLGMQAGIIIKDMKLGDLVEREGTYYDKNDELLVGGWAKVYIKGFEVSIYESVALDEYIGKKKDGEINGQWASKPATMIRKVALVHALREAFPEQNSGLYSPEEIQGAQEVILDEAPVIVDDEAPAPAPAPAAAPAGDDVADALFG